MRHESTRALTLLAFPSKFSVVFEAQKDCGHFAARLKRTLALLASSRYFRI
jgi:hypothetical protein